MLPSSLPVALALLSFQDAARVDFNRDVRPILSQNCFQCHGPDEETRAARLRLDIPGSLETDELLYRVTTDDPGDHMPPADSKKSLTSAEISTLERWVAQGAQYDDHWSFRPIQRPELPAVKNAAWPLTPIDRFVLAKLESMSLAPAPPADARTLIRRLYFDLTGMPPSPSAVDEFLQDTRPDVYERLVDRLLASSAYAERMTLAWMDAARYGDTSVYHADGPRDMWPWRDWVIEAYRSNMPFDRFTIDQLAGDLVPGATLAQRVASGFHRNNGTSDEGGAIDEELRVHYMVDRVKTTSNVWLGLSMECAQCHDHKFDPITQKDYYRFYAFFNQSVEKGFQTRNGNAAPLVAVPTRDQETRLIELDEAISSAEHQLGQAVPPEGDLLEWIEDQRALLADHIEPELGPWYTLGTFSATSSKAAFQTEFGPEEGIDLSATVGELSWQPRDWTDGQVQSLGSKDNSATYLYRTIHTDRPLKRGLSLGSDDSIQVWLNGDLVLAKEVGRAAAPDQERIELDLIGGENRFLMKIVNGGGPTAYYFKLLGIPLPEPVLAALRLDDCDRGVEDRVALREHYRRMIWPVGMEHVARLAALRTEVTQLEANTPTVMVMDDLPSGRMTYVLDRGQYDAPREDEPLEPGALERLLPMPGYADNTRLGLALWLTHPDHPLTARVAVNRYWAMVFGTGIVPTVMDFGSQGEWPSHPELLDWLASDFMASGWNVKYVIKQIVMSRTYMQSSNRRPELEQLDPRGRLLAYAPRFRLQGEFLRDQALAVSGLLVDEVGGPGVKPYQPDGLWNEVALNKGVRFVQDHGDKLYRKSMYIYWKRSSPMPVMTTFDAPTREKCVVQRQRTNTPLQALVLLNDVQFVEAARTMAERMLKGAEDFDARLDLGFELCTARPANDARRTVIRDIFEEQLATYRADPESALELLAVGESERDTDLDAAEHATWTVVASMLLNLDETLNRE